MEKVYCTHCEDYKYIDNCLSYGRFLCRSDNAKYTESNYEQEAILYKDARDLNRNNNCEYFKPKKTFWQRLFKL